MKALITGMAGFIGSHLFDAIWQHGDKAWGCDNFLTGRTENFNTPGHVSRLDILDRPEFYAAANEWKPDVVIHCAASYSDPDLWHRDTDTNVSGCINAAAVAKHHGAHLIYFQTILPPVSSYAISKIAGEQYLRLSGVPLTVLRLGNIYGPRNISGPIPVFYKRLTAGQPCTVVNTTRDMVYIADLVRAVRLVIEHRILGTFDVCSGDQTPISEIFGEVRLNLNMGHLGVEQIDPPDDDVQGVVDPANNVPMWAPAWSLRDGIRHTIDAYKQDTAFPTYTHLRLGAADAS